MNARQLTHADGRVWFGRVRGRTFQLVITVPEDEPLLRSYKALDEAAARAALDDAVRELLEDGFQDHGAAPWPWPDPRAGAVIVARAQDFTRPWVVELIEAEVRSSRARLPHGPGYRHRFVAGDVGDGAVACYYEISGYAERAECAAFEHAFFFIDNFALRLRSPRAPARFVALADVADDPDEPPSALDAQRTRIDDVAGALRELGCTLRQVREARAGILERGDVLWSLAGPENG